MADNTTPSGAPVNVSAGHLSVHLEGQHPADTLFTFQQQRERIAPALVFSLAYHIAFVGLIILAYRYGPKQTVNAFLPDSLSNQIVWLSEPGPGGGGGGGGNKMPEPPKEAELKGKEKITVPATQPKPEPVEKPKIEPPAMLNIPAETMAASADNLPGLVDKPSPSTVSQGTGTGGGAGTGAGTGAGPGSGSGLGPGYGGGTGGGAYRPGSGVTLPVKIREVKPAYTSDAMRAKVQGTVLLQCVVRPDGTVTDVEIVKSLDPTFGLDQEAVKAARQWLFRPGTRFGEPVPVLITIELTFTLR
jgi:protein TonB